MPPLPHQILSILFTFEIKLEKINFPKFWFLNLESHNLESLWTIVVLFFNEFQVIYSPESFWLKNQLFCCSLGGWPEILVFRVEHLLSSLGFGSKTVHILYLFLLNFFKTHFPNISMSQFWHLLPNLTSYKSKIDLFINFGTF